jgi:hypothetical protein
MIDFIGKTTLSEWSSQPPTCVTSGLTRAYIAWRGTDNTFLYIAALQITPLDPTAGAGHRIGDYELSNATVDTHQFDGETSPFSPAIAILDGRLYIAWVGENNHWPNIAEIMLNGDGSINSDAYGSPYQVDDSYIDEQGVYHFQEHTEINHRIIHLQNKQKLPWDTSSLAPSMTDHEGKLYLAWTGDDGDRKINIAAFDGNLSLLAETPIYDENAIPATTQSTPALLSAYSGDQNNRKSVLTLAWNSYYREFLFINHVDTGSLQLDSSSALILKETSNFGPSLAYYATDIYICWTGTDGEQHINVAPVKQYGLNGSAVARGAFPVDTFSDRASGATTIATLTTFKNSFASGNDVMIACWAGTDSALKVASVYET